jgi:hypothetical protein
VEEGGVLLARVHSATTYGGSPVGDAPLTRRQRCPCGGIVEHGAECAECRAKRLDGQTAGAPHSFREVSVSSGEAARGGGQETGLAPPTPTDVDVTPLDAPAKAPAPAAATLTKSEVTARTDKGCGDYVWAVKWGLSGATDKTNGFIVQQLTFDFKREKCVGDGRNDFYKRYWEAWEVRGGKIFVGTSASPHSADTFSGESTPTQKGVNREDGKAKFMPDYKEPAKWGKIPEARDLPATEKEPDGWSTDGAIDRDIVATFDCCGKTPVHKVEGTG